MSQDNISFGLPENTSNETKREVIKEIDSVMSQDNISFDLPRNRSNVIKVIGVGGGGSNAVNYMYKQGFKGVDFVVCNTDAQALHSSPVPNKIQLGVTLTEGLGAGASPEIGGEAAEESLKELEAVLTTNTKMLFLTAGMGGGTGTGAAPVIAKLAAKLGILTVGIVTMPFKFEGGMRLQQAQAGLEVLQANVDSMIVINNNKLRDVYGNLGLKSGFAKADEVLATAARGISEVITTHSGINIDLRDAKTVLEKSGTAIMGAAVASGDNRALNAITNALDSPLLNDNSIKGAKQVLLLIVSGDKEITLDEIGEISEYIQDQSGGNSNIIMGAGEEEGLGDSIKVTIIATGFSRNQQDIMIDREPAKKVFVLGETDKVEDAKIIDEEIKTVVKEQKPTIENSDISEKRIVHTLVEDEEEVFSVDDKIIEEIVEPTIAKQEDDEQKIIHTLEVDDDKEEPFVVNETIVEVNNEPETTVEKSTEKSIMDISDNDIVIQDMNDNQDTQTTIEFDFGSINNVVEEKEEEITEKKYFDLGSEFEEDDDETKTEVIQSTKTLVAESETVTDSFVDGSKRYNLEDFETLEAKIESAKPDIIPEDKEDEPEMQIHIVEKVNNNNNVTSREIVNEPLPTETFVDPTDIPLGKKEQIGRERRERLQRFNHRFRTRTINTSSVDDLERQPAYLRAGIELSSSSQRNNASRYSLGNNGDDVVLRKNNSFLHDNVD